MTIDDQTFREKLEDELRRMRLLRERGDHLLVRDDVRAAEVNAQAMAIAKHLEDAVMSAVRVATMEHLLGESEKWEQVEAEYLATLRVQIDRNHRSMNGRITVLKFLMLLNLLAVGSLWLV